MLGPRGRPLDTPSEFTRFDPRRSAPSRVVASVLRFGVAAKQEGREAAAAPPRPRRRRRDAAVTSLFIQAKDETLHRTCSRSRLGRGGLAQDRFAVQGLRFAGRQPNFARRYPEHPVELRKTRVRLVGSAQVLGSPTTPRLAAAFRAAISRVALNYGKSASPGSRPRIVRVAVATRRIGCRPSAAPPAAAFSLREPGRILKTSCGVAAPVTCYSVETSRGDAAAVTWIFRGDESRRRRGRDVSLAPYPTPLKTNRARQAESDVDIPLRRGLPKGRGSRGETNETPQATRAPGARTARTRRTCAPRARRPRCSK